MSTNTPFSRYITIGLCLLTIGGMQVGAMNIMRFPIQNFKISQAQKKGNFNLRLVRINIEGFFGSGTIVPNGYLSDSGDLSQSGLLTTTHIFQSEQIKEFLGKNGAINISGDNSMKCNYSFGESVEYAVFVPMNLIDQMVDKGWMEVQTMSQITDSNTFDTSKVDSAIPTQIFGSASQAIDISKSQVQKGDSGAMIYQKQDDNISSIGIQFGYAKNSTSPMTILWRLKKENNSFKANIAWFENNKNRMIWENGEYLPKNCSKI